MTIRPLKLSDIPVLRAMAEKTGYPYPDFGPRIESAWCVTDDEDKPIMAAAAQRIVELYLWPGEFERPLAQVYALRLLHAAMSEDLKQKGYGEANAFLPPELEKRFGRRLEKTFGWARNWASWFRKL